jgi:deoxyribodipyrimidine photo-lyase
MNSPLIVWFRNDLRLSDNGALHFAHKSGRPILPIYILDRSETVNRRLGGAQKWWLHRSLESLSQSLEKRGTRLFIFDGDPIAIISDLAKTTGSDTVAFNNRYDRINDTDDSDITRQLEGFGLKIHSFDGHLLTNPWLTRNKSGEPFRVFTPFWRTSLQNLNVPSPISAPKALKPYGGNLSAINATGIDGLNLLPTNPDWASGFSDHWTPGEEGAHRRLQDFLGTTLRGYAVNRNRPDFISTSRLSPHLAFGEISIGQVWRQAEAAVRSGETPGSDEDLRIFQSELGWRDFSYHLLINQKDIRNRNIQRQFDRFPWGFNDTSFTAWCRGKTGYPIVDAGLRELWQTGFMHNRVRMIVASFLVKHLQIDWRHGEQWFWDTLVDADPASNPASWQWVAGSGADAAPYFRIFNPVLQGEKFDPDGIYIKRFVPELQDLPSKYIHAPWTASPLELAAANVKLGQTYPNPVVDHDKARNLALDAYKSLKDATA